MAESKSQDSKKESISPANEEEFSEADLEKLIDEEDPEFSKSIGEIGQDKSLSLSEINITDEQQALNEEKEAWERSGKFGRTLYKILPFVPHISLRLKKLKFLIFAALRAAWIRIKNFLYFLATTGKKKAIEAVKNSISSVLGSITGVLKSFKKLNWKLKAASLGLVILTAGTGFLIYRSLTHGLVPTQKELFIPTMERVAAEVHEYDPATEVEPFYENLRASINVLLLPKMVVNLKKSSRSGGNPMGAFEFFVEGMAPEVTIEVKDREVEIRDLMQRVLEEFTFDQVDSVEGKKVLCDRLKKEVNQVLTTGKLKKVWFKTVIVKP